MRTQLNSFILARKLGCDHSTGTGIPTNEIITIAPRWVRGFQPHGINRESKDPADAPFVRVHYAGRHFDLYLSYREFIQALKDAGAWIIDVQRAAEPAAPA